MPPKSVLYLEDDLDLQSILKQIVKMSLGYETVCANSFQNLIENRKQVLDTDVAILDIELGNGSRSGIDARNWLKENGYVGRIAFLTAHGQSHPLVRRASRLGTEVLIKPVRPDLLMQFIEGQNAVAHK
jgi:DNA-binding NtrC family response regulator